MMMTTQKQMLRRKLMQLEYIGAKNISKSQYKTNKIDKQTDEQTKDDDFEDDDDYSKTNVEKKADAP